MDGNIINGGDVVRKILDFGDEFIRHLVEKKLCILCFSVMTWVKVICVKVLNKQSDFLKKYIFPMFQCSTTPVIKLIVNFCFLINVWHKMVLDKLDIFCLIISVFLYMLNYYINSTCLNQHLLDKIYACSRTVSMYVSRLDLILLFRGYDIELFTELTFFL